MKVGYLKLTLKAVKRGRGTVVLWLDGKEVECRIIRIDKGDVFVSPVDLSGNEFFVPEDIEVARVFIGSMIIAFGGTPSFHTPIRCVLF